MSFPSFKRRHLYQYYLLTRLNRPIGIYLLLWPTLWALWIAGEGRPDWGIVLVFVLGVIIMRSAGCVINDYADRHIDNKVSRTRERPLTSGAISTEEALTVFVILIVLAFLLVLTQNLFTILLSFGALFLAVLYPFMKRFTHLPQVFLGAAFSWAIPMAFAAQTATVPDVAWWLFFSTLLWIVAYDTQYAMTDREDDLKIGVKSTAILFGNADRLIIGLLQTTLLISFVVLGIFYLQANLIYYLCLAGAAGFALYQQYLIHQRKASACFQAFLNNHWLGMMIFLALLGHYNLSSI
ncbi:4-hydroxybenzoate octaprenyltransferase [Candidatus Venteria ishoeyi]|uniref:4-hydroxybenzoate octaprenyltransferase n=1 Tax=Candidatus Venteria ishoeyi TaxID=1899563 RepID=A0A1H6FHP8_9GAMM|nr:4-hydroxybenzoate octaprenyltransferase [Candidatus Venteria ishoeyi]MDM8546688.1 4-hydroxybenzoate octaprenyltransferase [Candidatus Venteria ishoeyi]SEH08575.1 4-hydroxybenzoate octaprenyltransferase [Candidatus Venteria ishoeyi]